MRTTRANINGALSHQTFAERNIEAVARSNWIICENQEQHITE